MQGEGGGLRSEERRVPWVCSWPSESRLNEHHWDREITAQTCSRPLNVLHDKAKGTIQDINVSRKLHSSFQSVNLTPEVYTGVGSHGLDLDKYS